MLVTSSSHDVQTYATSADRCANTHMSVLEVWGCVMGYVGWCFKQHTACAAVCVLLSVTSLALVLPVVRLLTSGVCTVCVPGLPQGFSPEHTLKLQVLSDAAGLAIARANKRQRIAAAGLCGVPPLQIRTTRYGLKGLPHTYSHVHS